MGKLSEIAETIRLPLDIAVRPYQMEHFFEGRAVLPAVEIMLTLASSVKTLNRDIHVRCMTHARFDKFLYIPAGTAQINAYNELSIHRNGAVSATLLTKRKGGKTAIIRTVEHAVICFPGQKEETPSPLFDSAFALKGSILEIPAERIYPELVPFGPCYHNIHEVLYLSENGIIATVWAPDKFLQGNSDSYLGSPFPLDATFHAACIWGQRFLRIVAFPVGFEKRTICKRTRPGDSYVCHVVPVSSGSDWIIFDANLYDSKGVLFETIAGFRLKDVSRGRMKPCQWIVA